MITRGELHSFLRANPDAWQLVFKSCDDYLLARLGLLNGLWSAFEMITQATEKLLKGYLLMKDPSLEGKVDAVRKKVSAASKARGRQKETGHDVEACLELARAHGFGCPTELDVQLKIINEYYQLRYPTNEERSLSTSDLHVVDEAVFAIWDQFKSIYIEYYLTAGVLRPAYAFRLNPNTFSRRNFDVLTTSNNAYETRRRFIDEQMTRLLAEWYPRPGLIATA